MEKSLAYRPYPCDYHAVQITINILTREKIFEGLGRNLCTLPGGRMTVGGEFATRLGESSLFQGGIARIRAWNHAQGDEEIRARAKASAAAK